MGNFVALNDAFEPLARIFSQILRIFSARPMLLSRGFSLRSRLRSCR
ncbi:hypothetical protein ACVIHI_000266 [Bradyrhizobium sp. USDA 4524]|nr:hypothetical protein [Bradyrhizobium sp. USDA 4538]MCP1898929.1 hypothetical protein [Bradyrhizobium sp. USDA 4537]MCP1909425.1 hypothetical protein [Bradyrhizobium elkanii]MCP1986957.1 hypothetical protein [Bradyrhizobium sp. USDA 4539]